MRQNDRIVGLVDCYEACYGWSRLGGLVWTQGGSPRRKSPIPCQKSTRSTTEKASEVGLQRNLSQNDRIVGLVIRTKCQDRWSRLLEAVWTQWGGYEGDIHERSISGPVSPKRSAAGTPSGRGNSPLASPDLEKGVLELFPVTNSSGCRKNDITTI